jgi:DNA-binding NtrC family response regulator
VEKALHVLVVDDEAILRTLLERILKKEGYEVFSAESVPAALDMIENTQIEIVVSDIKMPDADGFELLRRIKKDYPGICVIMMTGYSDAFSIKDVLMLGADDYITKPFKSLEISMIIERAYWRSLSGKESQVGASPE